jgi:hypothetical protein
MSATAWGVTSAGLKPMSVDYSADASAATDPAHHPLRLLIALRRAMPNWWPTVWEDIERISVLPKNWDGRGANQVDPFDVRDALVFLDRVMESDTQPPRVAPLSSGGIELLWRGNNVEVEAVFDRSREEHILLVEAGDEEWDAPIRDADSLFVSIRDRLTTHHALPA